MTIRRIRSDDNWSNIVISGQEERAWRLAQSKYLPGKEEDVRSAWKTHFYKARFDGMSW